MLDNFCTYQMDHKCVAVKSVGISVLGLADDTEEEVSRFVKLAEELIERGAEVIVIGCTGMTEVARRIAERLPVPLISPAPTALKMCEDMIDLGLSQSKVGFPKPAAKRRILY